MFSIGCPLWGYKEWVGGFFPARTPQSDFLRIYSQKLTAVEGNTTFYATPSVETVARWVAETAPGFRFCPKIPRAISHSSLLENGEVPLQFFIDRMRGLQERLGPMFLQLPPAFAPRQLGQLEAFLDFWPTDLRLAVEVRHPDFFTEELTETLHTLLRRYHAARVMMDTRPIRVGSAEEQQVLQARERKPDLPLHLALTTDFAFVRYIGHPKMEVNAPLLDEWARQMAGWLQKGVTVYAFCHCPFEVHSPDICYELYRRVKALVAVPALPWEAEREENHVEQGRLF